MVGADFRLPASGWRLRLLSNAERSCVAGV